jgi:hypothetical protein
MNLIIECVLVGIYCVFIYFFLYSFKNNTQTLLLLAGFIKHLFGYLLGFQQYYCKCVYFNQSFLMLFIECVMEAFIFLFVGTCFSQIIKNKIVLFFSIGVFLHLLFEITGVHSFFCMNKCVDGRGFPSSPV